MAELLASRPVVISLAAIGGLISVVASVLLSRGWASAEQARRLNRVGYAFMWVSIALFIYAGLR